MVLNVNRKQARLTALIWSIAHFQTRSWRKF